MHPQIDDRPSLCSSFAKLHAHASFSVAMVYIHDLTVSAQNNPLQCENHSEIVLPVPA